MLLARVPLFAGLGEADLAQLAAASYTKRLRSRQELCHKGDEGSQLYVVLRGRLRVGSTSAEGTDVLFNIMNPGDVIGEMALLVGGERTATVTALDECELLGLDRRDFLPLLRRDTDFAVRVLELLAERVKRLSELVEDAVFLNLPGRLAKKLLGLAHAYGKSTAAGVRIDLKLSQTDLSTMVGTTRESVNKQMRLWVDEGVLRMEGGYVTLLQRDALEELAGPAV